MAFTMCLGLPTAWWLNDDRQQPKENISEGKVQFAGVIKALNVSHMLVIHQEKLNLE